MKTKASKASKVRTKASKGEDEGGFEAFEGEDEGRKASKASKREDEGFKGFEGEDEGFEG